MLFADRVARLTFGGKKTTYRWSNPSKHITQVGCLLPSFVPGYFLHPEGREGRGPVHGQPGHGQDGRNSARRQARTAEEKELRCLSKKIWKHDCHLTLFLSQVNWDDSIKSRFQELEVSFFHAKNKKRSEIV